MAPCNALSCSAMTPSYVSPTYVEVTLVDNKKELKPIPPKSKQKKYNYDIYKGRQNTYGLPTNVSWLQQQLDKR